MRLRDLGQWLAALRSRYGETRVAVFTWIVIVGVASVTIRVLVRYDFHSSALLYVGIPWVLSLVLTALKPDASDEKWWHRYRDHSINALTVFFASSVVLFEGFVCVLFFLPIYFFFVTLAFVLRWLGVIAARRRGARILSCLPVLILATSLEGTTSYLSFERETRITVHRVVALSPEDVTANLARPIDLQKQRHWILSIFPMPYEIVAGSLNPGDVHLIRTRYHRWFVTNTHEGEMQLQIVEVEPDRVKTRFISDTTYFSHYMTLLGTEIRLEPLGPRSTRIELTVDYRRDLDPAWYFHPLQKFVMRHMGEFLIDEVMIRE